MAKGNQQATLLAFRDFVHRNQWSLLSEKDIQAAKQLLVSDGVTTVPVNCFVNGNIQAQGPTSPLKTTIQTWIQDWKTGPQPPSLW